MAKPSKVKVGKAKYCSKECFDAFQTGRAIPKKRTGALQNCLVCNKPFYVQKRKVGKKVFCSKGCLLKRGQLLTRVRKGKNLTCPVCGKSKYYPPSEALKGLKFCSQSCRSKVIKNGFKKGHKSFVQRKDPLLLKTDESKIWRRRIEYRLWREAVFARDGWTCQKCGVKGGELHPHHIKNFSSCLDLRFAIDNGITLCKKDHALFHKTYGKKNNTMAQMNSFLNKS